MSDTTLTPMSGTTTSFEHVAREIASDVSIGDSLAAQKTRGAINVGRYERWASLAAGGTLVFLGLTKRTPLALASGALGAALLYRGSTGHCPAYSAANVTTYKPEREAGIHIERTVTVDRPASDLYTFWRNYENLPRIMEHLEAVENLGNDTTHWTAKAPFGRVVSWDAVTTEDIPDERISWRSIEGADVDTAGSVRFVPAPGNRGTEVHVSLAYNPPAGVLGAAVAKLTGEEPGIQIDKDLRRFKMLMETGEIATTEGQPVGRAKN